MAPGFQGDEIVGFIKKAELFQGVSEKGLNLLAEHLIVKRVDKGLVVFTEGSPAEELYLVLKGAILEHVASQNDFEMVVKERLSGDYFGELGMLLDEPQFVTAIASQDTSLAILPKKVFLFLVRTEPALSLFLLRTLAHRLQNSAQILISYAFFDAPARLAYFILTLESAEGGSCAITHSQEELGQRCGLARQTVARILGEWRKVGWLRTGRNKIEAIDRKALQRILGMSKANMKN